MWRRGSIIGPIDILTPLFFFATSSAFFNPTLLTFVVCITRIIRKIVFFLVAPIARLCGVFFQSPHLYFQSVDTDNHTRFCSPDS